MTRRLVLTLLTCLGLALPGYAEVRVLLFQTQTLQQIQVSSPGGLRVLDEKTGSLLMQLPPQSTLAVTLTHGTSALLLQGPHLKQNVPGPLRLAPGRQQARLWVSTPKTPGRAYDGTLSLSAEAQSLRVCNQVSEQDYLTSVLAHEIPTQWPSEALKAQAVLCRTYLAVHPRGHAAQNADVCDLTHCQVFGGHSDDAAAANAVSSTQGLILTRGHVPIPAFYHSTCGGKTTDAEEVWPAPSPSASNAFAGVTDAGPRGDYCRESPYYTWELSLAPEELTRHLHAQGLALPAPIQTLTLDQCDSTGRVKQLTLHFKHAPRFTLSGEAFYRAWGHGGNWHQLKSTWFTVETRGTQFHFQGHGLGHGVGLCQWGARGCARAGMHYEAILEHYFPHAELTHWAPAPEKKRN